MKLKDSGNIVIRRNLDIVSFVMLILISLFLVISHKLLNGNDNALISMVISALISIFLIATFIFSSMRSIFFLRNGLFKFSLMCALAPLLISLMFIFPEEAGQYEMIAMGNLYAYFPWLCRGFENAESKIASVCYVLYRDDGQDALVWNPSDEMSHPVAEWPRPLLQDLEGDGQILLSKPNSILGITEDEKCTFGNTSVMAKHVFFVRDAC